MVRVVNAGNPIWKDIRRPPPSQPDDANELASFRNMVQRLSDDEDENDDWEWLLTGVNVLKLRLALRNGNHRQWIGSLVWPADTKEPELQFVLPEQGVFAFASPWRAVQYFMQNMPIESDEWRSQPYKAKTCWKQFYYREQTYVFHPKRQGAVTAPEEDRRATEGAWLHGLLHDYATVARSFKAQQARPNHRRSPIVKRKKSPKIVLTDDEETEDEAPPPVKRPKPALPPPHDGMQVLAEAVAQSSDDDPMPPVKTEEQPPAVVTTAVPASIPAVAAVAPVQLQLDAEAYQCWRVACALYRNVCAEPENLEARVACSTQLSRLLANAPMLAKVLPWLNLPNLLAIPGHTESSEVWHAILRLVYEFSTMWQVVSVS